MPIWIDEIADTQAWKTEFLKPEAKEVVEAVGAWIYCFRLPQDGAISKEAEDVMKAIQDVSEEHAGYGADAVMLAVAMPFSKATEKQEAGSQEEWDDMCIQYGFEYIDYAGQGKNEFAENTGFERLKEALEAHEWTDTKLSDDEDINLDDLELDDDANIHGFARDEAEMTAELFGMKAALTGDDFDADAEDFAPPNQQENQVEDLDRLMGRLLAVKEQSADLPLARRKRMAAKAVRELMADDSGK